MIQAGVATLRAEVSTGVRRLEVWVVTVALLPIATAIARHSGRRWTPIGDNALVELRSRDVFSWRHFPFLGTWSSASLNAGKDLNHPGPMVFDLLAVPVRLFGGSTGIALGVGLINATATVGIAVVGYKMAGRVGCLLATLTAATLSYSLGSHMLTDPWNPHVLILPCLLMFMLTWAVAAGRFRMLPYLLAVGSLCVQTHLSYAYLVPASCLIALAGAALVHRRRWAIDASTRSADLIAMRRIAALALATMLVLWSQPIIEQLTGRGQGNLARIATSTGNDEPMVGARVGARIIAAVVALPPWWGRSSIVGAVPLTGYNADGVTVSPQGVPRAIVALIALLVLGVIMLAATALAARRRDRPGLVAVVTSALLLAVALGSFVLMPIGPLGLTPHQMRWLWPMAAFTWFACALVLVRAALSALGERADGAIAAPTGTRQITVGLAAISVISVISVAVAVANVPRYNQLVGPDSSNSAIPVARSLGDQVDDFSTDQTVWFDTSDLPYLEPFSAVVMAALGRADIDFNLRESVLVRQAGNNRSYTGNEALRMIIREGRQALDDQPGMQRIAFTSPLTADEVDQLLAGERAMVDDIAVGGIFLTPEGEALVQANGFGLTRDQIEVASLDALEFVHGGLAAEMVAAGALDLGDDVRDLFQRTSTLRRRIDVNTVAIFVGPFPAN